MALPKIASPTYDLTVPSSKDTLKYRPFLVKEEKLLLLANESGEDTDIMNAVKQIIANCVFDKLEVDDLALFDLEYIFLRIRAKSVGEVVNLKLLCPDDEETYVDVSVNLDEVKVNFNEEHESTIQLDDKISLVMRYPQFSFAQESSEGSETEYIFKMIKSCIGSIVDGDTIYERADFTDKDLDEFMESLTSEHFQKMQKFFETMPRLQHEVKFKNPNTKKQQKVTLEGMNAFFA